MNLAGSQGRLPSHRAMEVTSPRRPLALFCEPIWRRAALLLVEVLMNRSTTQFDRALMRLAALAAFGGRPSYEPLRRPSFHLLAVHRNRGRAGHKRRRRY